MTAAAGVRRTVLPGGLRVISETVPDVRSVAFGVWVPVGSVDEVPSLAGSSHFLEHLLFKGTRRRSALDISSALDAVGGESNAFTSKEYTCFYARVLDDDMPLAVDVVCDQVWGSRVRASDVDSERGVVLEEIAMRDEDSSDLVHDLFSTALLGDTPLGRPVLGTVESIEGLSRTAVHGYYRRRYDPAAMVVAVAGNVEHDAVVAEVEAALARAEDVGGGTPGARAGSAVTDEPDPAGDTARRNGQVRPRAEVVVEQRPAEQANVVLGVPAVSRHDDRRYALGVANAVLGGGMSSRLFQTVREQRGLAYSVGSFVAQHATSGYLGVYAGCTPGRLGEVVGLCRDEVRRMAADGITDAELARGVGQLSGSVVLGLEDTGARMTRLGKAELVAGELPTVDELLGRVRAVTVEDVAAVCAHVMSQPFAAAAVGPASADEVAAVLV